MPNGNLEEKKEENQDPRVDLDQWIEELRRIVKAKLANAGLSVLNERNLKVLIREGVEDLNEHYEECAENMGQRLGDLEGRLPQIEEHLNHLSTISNLKVRLEAVKRKRDSVAESMESKEEAAAFERVDSVLSRQIRNAERELEAGNYEEAANYVEACETTEFNGERLVPTPSRQVTRELDREYLERALQRSDLIQHIARNDVWGSFDLENALSSDPIDELDAKILWNVLESVVAAEKEEEEWQSYSSAVVANVEFAEVVYKTAILGAGASAAYFIANNTLDLRKTILIGQQQPWAGERGADGHINHPHPLIDAEGYGAIDERQASREGLAERREFSDRIARVIARIPNQCDGRITEVSKERTDNGLIFWKITTNNGTYFAQNVHSALGAGEHMRRNNDGVDMDTYKRSIENVSENPNDANPESFKIGITGGSAAIDVVTDVLRKYTQVEIHWAPGSGAQFIPGTDNDVSAIPYYEALVRDGHMPRSEVPESIEAAKANFPNWQAYRDRLIVYPGRADLKANAEVGGFDLKRGNEVLAHVDKAVYAVGQDNVALSNLFVDNTRENGSNTLEVIPMLDINQHFNISGVRSIEEIRENLGADIGRMQPEDEAQYRALSLPIDGNNEYKGPMQPIDLLLDPELNPEVLARFSTELQVALGAQSGDGSLEFIGAQGFRELEAQRTGILRGLRNKYIANRDDEDGQNLIKLGEEERPPWPRRVIDLLGRKGIGLPEFTRDMEPLQEISEAIRSMGYVPETLPENVVNNAQLTSARERIVAAANSMPGLLTPDGLSFVTANQTAIAVHIATYYPNIKPAVADYVTAQIIVARSRPNGPIPRRRGPEEKRDPEDPEHDLQKMFDFQQCWVNRLEYFNSVR